MYIPKSDITWICSGTGGITVTTTANGCTAKGVSAGSATIIATATYKGVKKSDSISFLVYDCGCKYVSSCTTKISHGQVLVASIDVAIRYEVYPTNSASACSSKCSSYFSGQKVTCTPLLYGGRQYTATRQKYYSYNFYG